MTQPEIQAAQMLHTAARRYCIREYQRWTARYTQLCQAGKERDGDGYTNEALRTFPRYNILRAILIEIERLEPTKFSSVDEVMELLLLAGEYASYIFTAKPLNDIEANTIAEQRRAFIAYVRSINLEQLESIEPLPYRRVLGQAEAMEILNRLRKRWSIGPSFWHQLEESTCQDIAAFQYDFIVETVGPDRIRQFLRDRGLSRVWKFSEFFEHNYIMDVELFDLMYGLNINELWSSEKLDWSLHVSHEESVTIGGWLLERVKADFTNWPEQIWVDSYE